VASSITTELHSEIIKKKTSNSNLKFYKYGDNIILRDKALPAKNDGVNTNKSKIYDFSASNNSLLTYVKINAVFDAILPAPSKPFTDRRL